MERTPPLRSVRVPNGSGSQNHLEAAEFRALILELSHKIRVIGVVAATTGLRISEVLGLKWKNIDWKTSQMEVTRSVVDGIVGRCKTETSRRPVPIDEFTTSELLAWKRETAYAEPEDWVFASEKVQGRMPPWADTLLDRFLQPAAKRAGISPVTIQPVVDGAAAERNVTEPRS